MGSRKVRASGILAAILIAGCSGATPSTGLSPSPATPSASVTPTGPAAASPTAGAPGTDSLGIVLLSRGSGAGLWTVSRSGVWTKVRASDGGDAIAPSKDGVAIASKDKVRYLNASDLTDNTQVNLAWPDGIGKPIASVGVADDGRLALVAGADSQYSYAIAEAGGKVGPAESPASQPFAPRVAWLGADRRLLLATDSKQVSRLAVEDASGRVTILTGLGGCRWFGVSGDGKTIAVLTEDGVHVDTAERFLQNAEPQKVSAIPDGTVAWAVALSRDGTALAFLAGRLADDGSVMEAHEQVLTRTGSDWQLTLDSKLPFADVAGQAWAK